MALPPKEITRARKIATATSVYENACEAFDLARDTKNKAEAALSVALGLTVEKEPEVKVDETTPPPSDADQF